MHCECRGIGVCYSNLLEYTTVYLYSNRNSLVNCFLRYCCFNRSHLWDGSQVHGGVILFHSNNSCIFTGNGRVLYSKIFIQICIDFFFWLWKLQNYIFSKLIHYWKLYNRYHKPACDLAQNIHCVSSPTDWKTACSQR